MVFVFRICVPDTQAKYGDFDDDVKELPSAQVSGEGERGEEGVGTLIIIQLFMIELL